MLFIKSSPEVASIIKEFSVNIPIGITSESFVINGTQVLFINDEEKVIFGTDVVKSTLIVNSSVPDTVTKVIEESISKATKDIKSILDYGATTIMANIPYLT